MSLICPFMCGFHSKGAIRCVEGGGHYRPNKHAELSREIFRSLEWTVGDQNRTLTEKLVARRLHLRQELPIPLLFASPSLPTTTF